MYHRFDDGHDGFLDLAELKRMMEVLGAPQTHLGLKAMISEVDEDNDGRISFREVSQLSYTHIHVTLLSVWHLISSIRCLFLLEVDSMYIYVVRSDWIYRESFILTMLPEIIFYLAAGFLYIQHIYAV